MGHYIYIQAKTLLFVHSILVMEDGVEIRIFLLRGSTLASTVSTFNSCTRCGGSLGKIHDRTPDSHPEFLSMDAWLTPQLNVALNRLLRDSPATLLKTTFKKRIVWKIFEGEIQIKTLPTTP